MDDFSTADGIRLQQLQQGLSSAQRQVDEGTLTPEEGEAFQQQIHGMLQPLRQRQQAARQKAQAEQQQQVMHASALQESIQQHHAHSQAEAFPRTVSSYTDPLTGKVAHFFQGKRGEWEQVQFAEEPTSEEGGPAASGRGGLGGLAALGGRARGQSGVTGSTGEWDRAVPGPAEEEAPPPGPHPEDERAMQAGGAPPEDWGTQSSEGWPETQAPKTSLDYAPIEDFDYLHAPKENEHPQTAWNRKFHALRYADAPAAGKVAAYDALAAEHRDLKGRGLWAEPDVTSSGRFSEWSPYDEMAGGAPEVITGGHGEGDDYWRRSAAAPAGAAGQAAAGGAAPTASEHEVAHLRRVAERQTPRVQLPPGGIRNRQQAQFYRNQVLQRQKAVDGMTNHLVQAHLQRQQRERDQAFRSGENARQEEARAAAAEHRAELIQVARERRAEAIKSRKEAEKDTAARYRHHLAAVKKDEAWKNRPPEDVHSEALRRMKWEEDLLETRRQEGAAPAPAEEGVGGGGDFGGGEAAAAPPAGAAEGQAKAFVGRANEVIASQGQSQVRPMTPQEGRSPSSAGKDEVERLHAASAQVQRGQSILQGFQRFGTFRDMHGMLRRAKQEGRGLTVAERAQYERLHRLSRGHLTPEQHGSLRLRGGG